MTTSTLISGAVKLPAVVSPELLTRALSDLALHDRCRAQYAPTPAGNGHQRRRTVYVLGSD